MSYLLISLAEQQLHVFNAEGLKTASFAVSTAKNGAGQQEGSGCTPLGAHVVADCIGAGAPLNAVFVGRQATGEIYSPELAAKEPSRDWILTRILWLSGTEPEFNKGADVDSKARYIYIHGCPDSRPMGQPHSHGCITLHSADMLKLFALCHAGQRVLIQAD